MKQIVYLETTIISYLAARESNDAIIRGRQAATRLWWHEQRHNYRLVVSEVVVQEAMAGDHEVAQRRLNLIKSVRSLPLSPDAATLANRIVEDRIIPAKNIEDALHVALCAVNNVDYLLTWNCRHLANASHFMSLMETVAKHGYQCPMICTPEALTENEDVY